MQDGIEFDRSKLKDVVHFIIHYVQDKHSIEQLGNTKLHKILYYADMLNFTATGKPLTGDDYLNQQYGPTSRHLKAVVSELTREGRVELHEIDFYGFPQRSFAALTAPLHRLSNEETALLQDLADVVCERSARDVSELSHDRVWGSVQRGEVIPYYAAFGLFPRGLDSDDLEDARREVEEIGPQLLEAASGGRGRVF